MGNREKRGQEHQGALTDKEETPRLEWNRVLQTATFLCFSLLNV